MTALEDVKKYGYVNQPIDANIDLKSEILRLKKEKNAVILGHYYVKAELQDLSDYVGDSLQSRPLKSWAPTKRLLSPT